MSDHILDILIVLPLLAALVRGWQRGALAQFISLILLLLSLFVVTVFSRESGEFVQEQFAWNAFKMRIFVLTLFTLGFAIGVHVVGRVFYERFVDKSSLKMPRRLMGALLSGLRYAFVVSVFLVIFDETTKDALSQPETTGGHSVIQAQKDSSLLFYPLLKVAPFIYADLNFDDARNISALKKRELKHPKRRDIIVDIGDAVDSMTLRDHNPHWKIFYPEFCPDSTSVDSVFVEALFPARFRNDTVQMRYVFLRDHSRNDSVSLFLCRRGQIEISPDSGIAYLYEAFAQHSVIKDSPFFYKK